MRYALIGCGRIAKNHIKAAVANGLEIKAVCDIELERMEELLKENGLSENKGIKQYTDYQSLIEENDLDLAAVATESGSHAEIGLFCITHRVHVILEKPMAMSMKDAEEIISLAKENGVKVCICHQNRFNRAVQEARKALDKGRFGRLSHGAVNIRWSRSQSYYAQAPWRGTWARDGGALMNQCIHGIDLLRWMLGDDVEEVYGVTRQRFHDYLEAEDVGVAVVKFRNGSVGTIEGTTNVFPRNLEETLYLFGETGTVKLGGKSTNTIDVWEFADETKRDIQTRGIEEKSKTIYGNGHISLYADMIEAIIMGREPYVDGRAGRNALELVLAIYKSQKEGRPIKLPLEAFSSEDMSGEFPLRRGAHP